MWRKFSCPSFYITKRPLVNFTLFRINAYHAIFGQFVFFYRRLIGICIWVSFWLLCVRCGCLKHIILTRTRHFLILWTYKLHIIPRFLSTNSDIKTLLSMARLNSIRCSQWISRSRYHILLNIGSNALNYLWKFVSG